MYDFIGDIHGEFDKLIELLTKLGYKKNKESYKHHERKAFFLGDLIDRGPKIKETLDLVISMTSQNNAKCIMGNHEFNFICFHTKSNNKPNEYLRKRNNKHIFQCQKTLQQIPPDKMTYYLEWMKQLPLFVEKNHFRAVHAAWDQTQIKRLSKVLTNDRLTDENIHLLFDGKQNEEAMEITLKGYEIKLPNGISYTDQEGNVRTNARFCWWDKERITLQNFDISDHNLNKVCNHPKYSQKDKPVFFGHYWLQGHPNPFITSANAQCLDFSVAKNGQLAAYRFDKESILSQNKLYYV